MVREYEKVFKYYFICNFDVKHYPLTVYADDSDNVYCQYTGSTTASWGYKPNCTFTVNKIVGDKFKGSFSAQNIGKYSFSENVSGFVTRGNDCFT